MINLLKIYCMNKVYYPLHGSFYLRIEEYIKVGKPVIFQYNDINDNRVKSSGILLELFKTQDSEEEFLRLKSGLVLRLDQLVSLVDENIPEDICGINRDDNPCGDASDY